MALLSNSEDGPGAENLLEVSVLEFKTVLYRYGISFVADKTNYVLY